MALFDTTNATSTGVADGDHLATVVGAELKETKSGDGAYINVKFQLDGGMNVYKMFMIKHPNQKVVDIGLGQIGKLQVASGGAKGPVETTEELLGLRCSITVKNKTDDFGEKADIVNFKAAPAAPAAGGDLPF